ncbi:MAG: DUF4390 domain-containing protein [Deltaproteobacteria bacterium]|nr:DUF4390 domain-containing protein [Deltaproteobacteria bacterium]
MKLAKVPVLISLLLVILQWAPPARAQEAHLSDIVVTNTRDYLLLYFSVNGCFTPEMNRAIESGINTTFTFFVTLYEKRDFWWDRKMADIEINHSVKYDNLKKIFEVRLSEENQQQVHVLKGFEEVKRLMADVVALKVTPLHNLTKGGRYRISMMAQLDKIELPLSLHYVFFFLSLWDFETDWYSVDFRY